MFHQKFETSQFKSGLLKQVHRFKQQQKKFKKLTY
jgi:hypothetical protein